MRSVDSVRVRFGFVALLAAALLALVLAAPTFANADTTERKPSTTADKVTVTVYFKDTSGFQWAHVSGSAKSGTLFSYKAKDQKSCIADLINEQLTRMKGKGCKIVDSAGIVDAATWKVKPNAKYPSKNTTYTIKFTEPPTDPVKPTPTPTPTPGKKATVTVNMVNNITGATGWARGTSAVGTKLSLRPTGGKSLADHVNDWINKQRKLGYTVSKSGTTWPGNNGVYPTTNKTYKVTVSCPTTPVYWIVNKRTGENLYTPSKNEVNTLCNKKKTWINKGIVWHAPTIGKPVYRLVNKKSNDHLFTMSANEVRELTKVKKTWIADFGGKPVFYSGGQKPIWRFWSESRWKANMPGQHRFATYNAKFKGWTNEGTQLYAARY